MPTRRVTAPIARGVETVPRHMTIDRLEEHPNLPAILGVLAQLPHITDADLPKLAAAWRNMVSVAEARCRALSPDSPLVIEVLAAFDAISALFADDIAGDTDYVKIDPAVTVVALKAVRDAVAAVYARPILSRGEYGALMGAWRSVYPRSTIVEPDLGPAGPDIKRLLGTLPQLARRCHDLKAREAFEGLVVAALTLDEDEHNNAIDTAFRAAVRHRPPAHLGAGPAQRRRGPWPLLPDVPGPRPAVGRPLRRRAGARAVRRRSLRAAGLRRGRPVDVGEAHRAGQPAHPAPAPPGRVVLAVPLRGGPQLHARVQASRRSTVQVLTTTSGPIPHSCARAHPYGCHSSWPGAWASVSMDTTQPASTASPQQPLRRVEPLRPAVHLDGHPEAAAGLEDQLGVELRFGPAAPGDHAARAMPQDVDGRVRDGADHPRGHLRRRHPQLRMHRRDHDVERLQQVLVLVERAVLVDVDLDAGQDAERGQPLVDVGARPAAGRADAAAVSPLATVSRGEWSVSAM